MQVCRVDGDDIIHSAGTDLADQEARILPGMDISHART